MTGNLVAISLRLSLDVSKITTKSWASKQLKLTSLMLHEFATGSPRLINSFDLIFFYLHLSFSVLQKFFPLLEPSGINEQ